jgi:serine/threonine-protein kinase HipA
VVGNRVFDIYLYDARVGTLTPRGRGVRFAYAREALDDGALPALSVSLPKRDDAFPDSEAGPFFRNLLPEQAYRRLVATAVGSDPENSVALLGAIGGECPGAVSIWPAGSGPPPTPEYEPLDSAGFRALFSAADRRQLARAVTRGRLSLAGAQEKIALLRTAAGEWRLPLRGAVTSHILKEAAREFAHILENELFCARLAGGCGLSVPPTELVSLGVRVLSSERFDRPAAPSHERIPRRKLHQEDFCQVLAVNPERKYEADGGPGLKKCAAAIRRHSGLPADDLVRLVRWVGFNFLIGNEDAHAKNLAFLYLPHGLRLTPHYDLVSTEVYSDLGRRLAMKLGQAWDIRNVQRSDWKRVANAVDVPWDQARTVLLELSARMQAVLSQIAPQWSADFGSSPIYDEITAVIARHTANLELALGIR